MLGNVGQQYRVEQVTTDGRVSFRNGNDSSILMAEFVEIGDRSCCQLLRIGL